MNNAVRQTLCEIIAQYGTSLCEDRRRCEGLLRDLCPDSRLEINILITALKCNVPTELVKTKGVPAQSKISRLLKNIIDDFGSSEEVARWAVESWALALGIISSVDITDITPTEPDEEIVEQEVKPRYTKKPTLILIEFRLRDESRQYAQEMILEVARKFHVYGGTNFATRGPGHPRNKALPPHMRLYGTAMCRDIEKVINAIERVGKRHTLVPFNISGSIAILNNRTCCLTVNPSKELEKLRHELAEELNQFCDSKPFDSEDDFLFHIDVAYDKDALKIRNISHYLRSKYLQTFSLCLTRLTLLDYEKEEIICEYDLKFKTWLSAEQALDKSLWEQTMTKLHESPS